MRIEKIEIRAPLIVTRLKVAAGIPLLYASQPVCSCSLWQLLTERCAIWRKPLNYTVKIHIENEGRVVPNSRVDLRRFLPDPTEYGINIVE